MLTNEKLIEILPNLHLIKNKEDIGRATRLQEDLQLYEEDLVNFIVAYSETFGVDISTFNLNIYFTGRPLLKGIGRLNKKKRTITLGDLDRAISVKILNNQTLMEVLDTAEIGASTKIIIKKTSQFSSQEKIAYIVIGIVSTIILIATTLLI